MNLLQNFIYFNLACIASYAEQILIHTRLLHPFENAFWRTRTFLHNMQWQFKINLSLFSNLCSVQKSLGELHPICTACCTRHRLFSHPFNIKLQSDVFQSLFCPVFTQPVFLKCAGTTDCVKQTSISSAFFQINSRLHRKIFNAMKERPHISSQGLQICKLDLENLQWNFQMYQVRIQPHFLQPDVGGSQINDKST